VLRRVFVASLLTTLIGAGWVSPSAHGAVFDDYVGVCQMKLTISAPTSLSLAGSCTMLLQKGDVYPATFNLGTLTPAAVVGFGCSLGAAFGSLASFTLDTPQGQRSIGNIHVTVLSAGGVYTIEVDKVPEISGSGVFPMGANCASPPHDGLVVFEDPDPLVAALTPA
jgi:hypothetical protein